MMKSRHIQDVRAVRSQAGFSLVEIMVGLLIGLLCTLVIATVLSSAESQRRGTTHGSDAQVNGALALYTLQRELAMAGYGFASEADALGCTLQARFNGAVVAALPQVLAPVFIAQGAVGASDTIRIVSSSKYIDPTPGRLSAVGYTIPTRLIGPYYDPAGTAGAPNLLYNVYSSISVRQGDLMAQVIGPNQNCGLFQVTANPTAQTIPRANDPAAWNPVGHPAESTAGGGFLVNLGRFVDIIFSVDANSNLVASTLDTSNLTRVSSEVQGSIVMLKAMYGHSAAANGVVDTYNYATPVNNAGWNNMLSVRLAILARSAQYEKEEVTKTLPVWDVGTATAVAGAVPCGSSMCVSLDISNLPDWKHYRYKLFDTVVSLRNQRWKSV